MQMGTGQSYAGNHGEELEGRAKKGTMVDQVIISPRLQMRIVICFVYHTKPQRIVYYLIFRVQDKFEQYL